MLFLFKGPLFFYIRFKISKLKQQNTNIIFLHFSWLNIKGKSNFSLKIPALPACLNKISDHNTAQKGES